MPVLLHRRPLLLRLTAGVGVALVLWLSLLVASPDLHAWLHHHDGSGSGSAMADVHPSAGAGGHHHDTAPVGSPEHHCAVTLFAAGVEPLVFLVLCGLLGAARCVAVLRPESARLFRTLPRYWHVPAHGPPSV